MAATIFAAPSMQRTIGISQASLHEAYAGIWSMSVSLRLHPHGGPSLPLLAGAGRS